MRRSTEPGFVISDPREIRARAPYTFYLPSMAELAAAKAGDHVQLVFEYTHQTKEYAGERMWVTLAQADNDLCNGSLSSVPYEPTSPLKKGDLIEFDRNLVIDIAWADPENAPVRPMQRSHWERCLVEDCVLFEQVPVEFLYREEPDMQQEADEYPDSGWRIRGRIGEATDEELDARKISYVALGAVLNKDDSWIDFIDDPVGTRLLRDFSTGLYSKEG